MSGDARPGEFVAADGGARWAYAGTLTFANAEAVLESAGALPLPSSGVADLAGLRGATGYAGRVAAGAGRRPARGGGAGAGRAHADSAALAVLLALKRRAAAEGTSLAFASVPDSVVSLARVYGIDTIVGV